MTQQDAHGDGEGEIKRIPSYVTGLDTILGGGFLEGGLYLVQGRAGAGKTIYGHGARGRALSMSPFSVKTTAINLSTTAPPPNGRSRDRDLLVDPAITAIVRAWLGLSQSEVVRPDQIRT